MARGPAATSTDVAALAGVSARTVSNVVRGYVHVRPETRRRVQEAIDQLNYRPNRSAQSLRRGRTGVIALAIPEIAAPYFAELSDHIQRHAAARGVTLLIDQTGADRERELLVLEGYRSQVIDGLVLSPMAVSREDLLAHASDLPTVLLGEGIADSGLLHVAIDNVAAAREATAHLLGSGRRRIAAVGADLAPDSVGPAAGRVRGYLDALAAAGVPAPSELRVRTGGWFRATGYRAVTDLITSGVQVDALFCFNDVLALGALRALADLGLRVPQDVAVVGWDDIEQAEFTSPSLTTVSPDKGAIARTAVDRLLDIVEGREVLPEGLLCRHSLVVRETTSRGSVPPTT